MFQIYFFQLHASNLIEGALSNKYQLFYNLEGVQLPKKTTPIFSYFDCKWKKNFKMRLENYFFNFKIKT